MKVRFRQSGGFAGLVRGCDLDTDNMEGREGEELRSLVASGTSGGGIPARESLRDGILYEITVDGEGGVRHFRYEDTAIPGPAVPLVSFLRDRSGPLSA